MKKVVLLVFIAILLVALSGCLGETTETKVKTEDNEIKMKTTTSEKSQTTTVETTVKTEEGEQTTTITGTAGSKADEWCPEGGDWKMQTTGVQGEATATWKIDKLEKSGKYAGLCHVIYTAQTPEGEMKIEYWFDENGENGYMEMEVGGQKITQEWHG